MSAESLAPLDRAAILTLVQSQLAEILEKSPGDIIEDESFEDLGADSLALIETRRSPRRESRELLRRLSHRRRGLKGLVSVRDAVNYVAVKLQVA